MSAAAGPEAERRPPAGAVRDAELDAWVVCGLDASGARHGDCAVYRDDGTLMARCRYESGRRAGPFSTFHPNGELASEGEYREGLLEGVVVRHVSSARGGEPLRACCVPPGAKSLHASYKQGVRLRETFFDEAGRALLADGRPMPERAPGLPEEADFNEAEGRWLLFERDQQGSELRRSFDLTGRLLEETTLARDRTRTRRHFDERGELLSHQHFDDAGRLHGESRIRFPAGGPYADGRIAEERGQFEHGQSTGATSFLDEQGGELRRVERGRPISEATFREFLREAAATEPGSSPARIARLLAEGRVREALFSAACEVSRSRNTEPLEELLRSTVVPLEPKLAEARAATLEAGAGIGIEEAFEALLSGAEPASVLRVLATLTPATSTAAREVIEAAVLLRPTDDRLRATRALIALEQGDVTGALEDARALGPNYAAALEHVEETARLLYREPDFAPGREPPSEGAEAPEQQVGVEQPLDAVGWAIGLYATRIGRIRGEIRTRLAGAEPPWLPPDLSQLGGSKPVELRRFRATIRDEEQGEVETSEVEIDETLDLPGMTVRRLLAVARADLDALSWLCWSVGLDELAQPKRLAHRPAFTQAVNDAMLRCFRAHDQLRTAGLVSRARGVPGFLWEGRPVDELSRPLAEIAAAQYLERRAAFFWLLFPQNLSPFQSDLRNV